MTDAAGLPTVSVLWDTAKAYRERTATRERICLNGLWRWQPDRHGPGEAPSAGWGYLRVPEVWPGGASGWTDGQLFRSNAEWANLNLGAVTSAWYQREITIPAEWSDRRIALTADYVNSHAAVYLDGAKAGEIQFPGGEVDLGAACRPGRKQVLSLRVEAVPLGALMRLFENSDAPPTAMGQVERRGLLGDVHLASTPQGARITEVKVETSVRRWQITFDAALTGIERGAGYALHAQVRDGNREVKRFISPPFHAEELAGGRMRVTQNWRPDKLWDTATPDHQYGR